MYLNIYLYFIKFSSIISSYFVLFLILFIYWIKEISRFVPPQKSRLPSHGALSKRWTHLWYLQTLLHLTVVQGKQLNTTVFVLSHICYGIWYILLYLFYLISVMVYDIFYCICFISYLLWYMIYSIVFHMVLFLILFM